MVRDMVIGLADGLTVPFALAAGLAGTLSASHLVVIAGLAEIAAGSIAMGLGGYLASRGDTEHYAAEKRLANSGLEVTQLQYDPFAKPRRAAWQEFGDVLAEGLYTLVHLGRPVEDATADYWGRFLEVRRSFLESVVTRAESAPQQYRDQVVQSLR